MNPAIGHLPPLQLTFDPKRVSETVLALWPWILVGAGVMGSWMWAVDYWHLDLTLALWFASDDSMLDATVWISAAPVLAAVAGFLVMLLHIAVAGYVPQYARFWRDAARTEPRVRAVHRPASQQRPPRSVRA